jgi:phage terminase large subunit-like protein
MDIKLKLSKWQKRFVVDEFDAPLRIAVTGIGSGKSRALAVWIVLQCLKKPGLRGIVLAQIYKTLTRVLVREIQVVASIMGVHYDYNKSSMEMVFPNKSILYFYSGENATGVLGLSEIDLLAMDEAAYLAREVYDFSRDRMRGGKYTPMVRLISSPVNDQLENWFRDLCMKYQDCVVNAATYDNPFVSEAFIQELKDRYIEGSTLYQQQVQGLFLDTDIASQLVKRADFIAQKMPPKVQTCWLGADFSGGVGCDFDCVAVVDETGVLEVIEDSGLNTQQKVSAIHLMWSKYSPSSAYGDNTGGFGQGAIDLSEEKGMLLHRANFSAKPFNEDLYPNLRTEAYAELARDIRNGFFIPEDIRSELLAQQVTIDNRGRIALVPKELVKKALGRSPDRADAIALANYARNHGGATVGQGYSAQQAQAVGDRYLQFFLANN